MINFRPYTFAFFCTGRIIGQNKRQAVARFSASGHQTSYIARELIHIFNRVLAECKTANLKAVG